MTYGDVMGMTISDVLWFAERVHDNRDAEAAAMRNAKPPT